MGIPTLQHAIHQRTPPPTFEHVTVHEDNSSFTMHSTVTIPDIVPVTVNFNEDPSAHIGRAKLRWNQEEGRVYADVWLDTEVPDLASPPVFLLGTQGHDLMEFEEVNYCMNGIVTALGILTNAACKQIGRSAEADDGTPPQVAT